MSLKNSLFVIIKLIHSNNNENSLLPSELVNKINI